MGRQRPLGDLPDVFVGAEAVAVGLLTHRQLRGPRVARVLRGVYRPAWVRPTHVLTCRAASLILPPQARVTGRSAATVRGCDLLRAEDDVEVLLPEHVPFGPYRGLVLRGTAAPVAEGPTVRGVPLTSTARTAFDLAARRPLPEATAYLDAFARQVPLEPTDLSAWLEHQHCHDVIGVRAAAALMDARAESLHESRLRVVLALDGIVMEPQLRVEHDGRQIARLDLGDEQRKVGVEYDGAWHVLREQLERDRQRMNLLALAGWHVVHVTAAQLSRPREVVALVRHALAARSR